MKIIGINCSPRKGQTTQKSLEVCLKAAREESSNIRTDIVELAGLDIRGCLDCDYCRKQLKCKQEDDFNSLISALNDKELTIQAIQAAMLCHDDGLNKGCVLNFRKGAGIP